AACAADPDHADARAKLVDFRPDEINAHGPDPPFGQQRVERSGGIFESLRVACQGKKLTSATKLGKTWPERLTYPQAGSGERVVCAGTGSEAAKRGKAISRRK